LTVRDEDKDKDSDNDLQEDAVSLEARIHQTTVDMFKRVLLFSQGAAEALYDDQKIKTLTNQKTLEDSLLDTKPPETPALTLEPHLAAKAFNDMLILLGKMRGIAGHPLSYVPRPSLKGPNDADPDDKNKDPSPFGQPGSPYVLIDDKLCRRAPILRTHLTHLQLSVSLETLETDGPFEPSCFLTNMATVYNILHSCWGKSSWWHHTKKFIKTKNGRQVYRTLHTPLLGGQQVVSTRNAICTKLQSFRYEGDRKNFNFDKYVNLHIEQHNHHADLQEYGVAPLAESLKTLWFQDGIRDPSLNAVKASINANRANFTHFDSVKDATVEFKCTENPTIDRKTRQVASVARGGRGGGSVPRRPDQGQGPRPRTNARCNLFPNLRLTSRLTL
jgi:hypothetical protein